MVKEEFKRARPHVNIDTIGHVDHGETTLTAAISKTLYDKGFGGEDIKSSDQIDDAPEEKECGITVNSSHIEYEAAKRHYAHVDCPGHADYVRDTVTGAAQMDDSILVIAVANDPMPQACEYVLLARQVSVSRLVIFMNRCDLAEDEEMLKLIEMELRELLKQYEFEEDTPIVRDFVLGTLDGIDRRVDSVMTLTNTADEWTQEPGRDLDKSFLMPVEDAPSVTGHDTVVTGRIKTGKVKVGDEIRLLGLDEDEKSVITGVEMFRKILSKGEAGDNVGLLFRDIDEDEVKHGVVVVHSGAIAPRDHFKAPIHVLRKEEGGRYILFGDKYRPQFYLRTTDYTGEITLPEGVEMVVPDDNVGIEVTLIYKVALNEGLRFTIREGGHTVGSG